MIAKRIIPCMDVKNGEVVKGTRFRELKFAGNAVDLARRYYDEGADELVFLDIGATVEGRKTMIELVGRVAKQLFIPLTVGGGINSLDGIRMLLNAGADKVSINTAAVRNPDLIKQAAGVFGRQCIVVAIDAKKKGKKWEVVIEAGARETGLDALGWAKKAEQLGAGEILLTSMDADGTKKGYAVELTRKVSESVGIPLIASGGAGNAGDICSILKEGRADAALAASIFHYGKYSVREVKEYLAEKGIWVRL